MFLHKNDIIAFFSLQRHTLNTAFYGHSFKKNNGMQRSSRIPLSSSIKQSQFIPASPYHSADMLPEWYVCQE